MSVGVLCEDVCWVSPVTSTAVFRLQHLRMLQSLHASGQERVLREQTALLRSHVQELTVLNRMDCQPQCHLMGDPALHTFHHDAVDQHPAT